MSPLFSANLRVFYIFYVFFVSPYFYHDAFMHHTMHVLEAPVVKGNIIVHSLTLVSKHSPQGIGPVHVCMPTCLYVSQLALDNDTVILLIKNNCI